MGRWGAAAVLLTGCIATVPAADPADDGGRADARGVEAGADSAGPVDAQPADARPADAQPTDARPADAQPLDAQPPDPCMDPAIPREDLSGTLADCFPVQAPAGYRVPAFCDLLISAAAIPPPRSIDDYRVLADHGWTLSARYFAAASIFILHHRHLSWLENATPDELLRAGLDGCEPFPPFPGESVFRIDRALWPCTVEAVRRFAQTLRQPGAEPLPLMDVCGFYECPAHDAIGNPALQSVARTHCSGGFESPSQCISAFGDSAALPTCRDE